MTPIQICNHKRDGLTVKVDGQDGKTEDINWREDKVTVGLFGAGSAIVKFSEVESEWTGGAWNPGMVGGHG